LFNVNSILLRFLGFMHLSLFVKVLLSKCVDIRVILLKVSLYPKMRFCGVGVDDEEEEEADLESEGIEEE